MEELKDLNIPEVKAGDVTFSKINVSLGIPSPDSVSIGFDDVANSISLGISNLELQNVSLDFVYKKSIITISGDAAFSGTIDTMNSSLIFET